MTQPNSGGVYKWIAGGLLTVLVVVLSVGASYNANENKRQDTTITSHGERLRATENGQTELRVTLEAVNRTLVRIEKKLDG